MSKIIDKNEYNSVYILLFVFGLLIGLLVGFFTLKVNEKPEEVLNEKEYIVVFNGEEQTFRDSEGHRLQVKEEDGVLYLPIQEKGLFFDYDIEVQDNQIVINEYNKPSVLNFDTVTLKGNRFTSEFFYNYDYTLLLNWTTWCPDCDKLLNKLVENWEIIKELNIQVVGIPYVSSDRNILDVDKEVDKILNDKGLSFPNILSTTEIENLVQTNLTNIPTLIIVDNKGRILAKDSDVEIDLKSLLDNIHSFDICSEC